MSSIPCLGIAGIALLLCTSIALAGSVTIPNTFTAHTPAQAAQVNANFGAVATSVNGSASDITNLQAAIASMQSSINLLNSTVTGQQTTINALNSTVATQQTTITTLTAQMTAVQTSSVMELANYLNVVDVPDPNNASTFYRTALFHHINVQVVNGTDDEETSNGLGNVIVGYNPASQSAPEFCAAGQYTEEVPCQGAGSTWAANQRSGSHNLIVGSGNAYTQYGGFVAGARNVVNRGYASISGGIANTASGSYSSISGGHDNKARGQYSSISGGSLNTTTIGTSSISGGNNNTASNNYASISGGIGNMATGYGASISGGFGNTASGEKSSVSGGNGHDATGQYDWRAGSLFEDL